MTRVSLPASHSIHSTFAYHGGIYRDVWMIVKSPVAITDAVEANRVAGGGVFVHFDKVSDKSAEVIVNTDVANNGDKSRKVYVETSLIDPEGKLIQKSSASAITLKPGHTKTVMQTFHVKNPQLWSPDSPTLYRIESRVKDGKETVDGGETRVGIRYFEFDGDKGFILNGKPFGQLVGANRHQDFAYVGNAVPNSQQWRDAKRLRDAGCRIIRVAHYPQDPSFMDACDELGMFVIVATPGWQFWNKDPKFAEKSIRTPVRLSVATAIILQCLCGNRFLTRPAILRIFHLRPFRLQRMNIPIRADRLPQPTCTRQG